MTNKKIAQQQQQQSMIRHIEGQFGYRFDDINLLKQALTHRSAAKEHNERLEFLGDAVLGMVTADWLYANFPNVAEGKLTRMRSSLVKGDTLAALAKQMHLGEWLALGPGELKSGGHRRASILADVVEAIFGAIYLEGGIEACRPVILKTLAQRMAKLNPDEHPKDNKTRLQEYLQSRKLPLPVYEVLDIKGKDHDQTFVVSCTVEVLEQPVEGKGISRRRAEQDAAQQTMQLISQENTK